MAYEELTDYELGVHLRRLRAQIDGLEKEFSLAADAFRRRGGHLALGHASAVAWLRTNCNLSSTSAADRLCVGKELESVPELSRSIEEGEVGFQSAAAVCHLMDQIGDKREKLDPEALLEWTRKMSVGQIRNLCRHLRYFVDPDGAERSDEVDFERRWLKISKLADGMHVIDGILDAVGGAAIKAALEGLAGGGGARDGRRHSQRMADALVELAHHALESGVLPARNGAKPHLNVTTTLEGLQGLPGGATVEGAPISQKTLERVACDSTVSRVMLAGSAVIDVGRATRSVSAAMRRALKARDKHCRFPGCDRPPSWTAAHHIEFWSHGGKTRVQDLVLLCHYHHRLVHEGGWQVVKAGPELRFIPPDRPPIFMPWRARGPGVGWAA
jgi:hypothetical protein